jgi:integrase
MPKRRDPKTGYFIKAGKSYDYLFEYSCVKEWVASYSANTAKHYLQALEKFCKWTNSNPDDLLKLDPEEAKEKVLRLAKEYAGAGKHGKAISIFNGLKSFFGYHNKQLNFNRYRRQFIKNIREKVDYELIPDNELVYRMVDVCRRPIDRAVIICLFQSGIRINALHRLNYGHVREQLERNRVPIRLKITSNIDTKLRGVGLSYYYSFIGKEAVDALTTYLEALKGEGVQLKDEDPLFRSKYGKRLAMQSIYRIVKTAAGRLETGKQKIWPHLLRKSFRKVLNRSDLDEDTREALMGHKLPGSRANYFDFHDIDEIEQKYASCNFSREAGANAMRLFTEQLKKKEQDIEKLKETIAKMQPLVEFVNSFNSPRELKEILDFLKDDSMVHSSYDPTIQFDKSIADKVNEIAKRNDITQAEALGQLAEVEWKRIVEDDEKRKKLAKARGLSLTREDYKEQKKKRRLRK